MIEDPRVSDDTPERARWETWAENLRGGDRFSTVSGVLIVDEVLEDGIVDREGNLHDWTDVGPPEDEPGAAVNRPITECPLWRWRDGAATRPDGYGRTWRWIGGVAVQQDGPRIPRSRPPAEQLAPATYDPATVGCLLALVREALGDPLACVIARNANEWEVHGRVERGSWPLMASGATEWDALCAALWDASERAR